MLCNVQHLNWRAPVKPILNFDVRIPHGRIEFVDFEQTQSILFVDICERGIILFAAILISK